MAFFAAHHDDAPALDRHPVDEDLVARRHVIGERFEPPLPLGAQFVLVVARDEAPSRTASTTSRDLSRAFDAADRATCAGEICAAVCLTFLVA